MNNLDIDVKYNGINVKCRIENKVNLFSGYSGTGKTLLLNAVKLYCYNNHIRFAYCNYNQIGADRDAIIGYCNNVKVVLLDNADLYLDSYILEEIKKKADYILVCIREITKINAGDADRFKVRYENMKLEALKV